MDRHGAGRGAWLCRGSDECLEAALRRHGFERAFRVPLGSADLVALRAGLAAASKGPRPDVRG